MFDYVVRSWWSCLGRTRRCELVGGGVTGSGLWGAPPHTVAFRFQGKMWVLSCSSHHAFTLPPGTLPSGAVHSTKCFLLQAPLVMVFCHSKRKVTKTAPTPWRRGGEWIYPASEIINCQWLTSSLRGEEIGVIHGGVGVLRDNEKPLCDSNTDPKSVLRDWVGTFLWKGLSLNLLHSQKWPWTSYPPTKCQSYRCASGLA